MSDETKPTEVSKETEVAKATEVTSKEAEKTIPVDIYGETIELPLSKAKLIISKRDEKTQGYKQLQEKVNKAEAQAKSEAERANLLQLMKAGEAEAVEAQVSAKYKDTIAKFEKKVFNSTVESSLSKLGILPDALSDATKLVMADAKATLEEDEVKLNGVKVDEYLGNWVKSKQHLVSAKGATPTGAKQGPQTRVAPKAPVNPFTSLTRGLKKLGEQTK